MSIASELTTLADNKAAIKAAIIAKNPATAPTDVMSQWSTSIASIPEGRSHSNPDLPVRFLDYDGAVLYSYTAAEAQALTALPALPVHEGLTCQGWNYTLQQVKDTVSDTGYCDVGATHITSDGKTHIHITLRGPEYRGFKIKFIQSADNGVSFDWGDGSAAQTYTGTEEQLVEHQYQPASYPQSYDITLAVASGATFYFPTTLMGQDTSQSGSNPVQAETSVIDAVYLGSGITQIGNNTFRSCYSLKYVTIPEGVTKLGQYAFRFCTPLECVVVPSTVTRIDLSAMQYCYSLKRVSFPPSVTSISQGLFQQCYAIERIALPSTVTTIATGLANTAPSLQSVVLPSGITSMSGDKPFYGDSSLTFVRLPPRMTAIGPSMFYNCPSLQAVKFPSGIVSVAANAFAGCYGIVHYDFSDAAAVPTLPNTNAFDNTNVNKKIVVPDALYDTWIATAGWDSSTNSIKESIVKASESPFNNN